MKYKIEQVNKLNRIVNVIGDNGDFLTIFDEDIVIDALKNLFGIEKGTYYWDDDLGTDIVSYIQEFFDRISIQEIVDSLTESIIKYVPYISLDSIKPIKSDQKNTIELAVVFRYNGNKIARYYKISPDITSVLD